MTPRPIRDALVDPVDDAALARVWAGVQAARAPVRGRLLWAGAGLAAVAVAGAVVAAVLARRTPDDTGPLRMHDGRALADVEAPGVETRLSYADGSEVTLAPATRLRAGESTATTVKLTLAEGAAGFRVQRGTRVWHIDAGAATIEVYAGRFRVASHAASLELEVDSGVVVLRTGAGVRTLLAGERVRLPITPPALSPAPPPPPAAPPHATRALRVAPPTPIPPRADDVPTKPTTTPTTPTTPTPPWRTLLAGQQHREAYAALGPDGLARAADEIASVEELLGLADVARFSGHSAQAVPLLRRYLEAPQARTPAVAAFTLGRIYADDLANAAAARAAFERALSLGLPADLVEPAQRRVFETSITARDEVHAIAAAQSYLARNPTTPPAARIRAWLDATIKGARR